MWDTCNEKLTIDYIVINYPKYAELHQALDEENTGAIYTFFCTYLKLKLKIVYFSNVSLYL